MAPFESQSGATRAFPRHYEAKVRLDATPEAAFAHLDDFRKLSAHMEQPSPMLIGSRMSITSDAGGGRAVGSNVHMQGQLLGMTIVLDETVTRRDPPWEKAWRASRANLIVIGRYELGFRLSPDGSGSVLRVFVDYELPGGGVAKWLGRLLGDAYARWCVHRMVGDAARHFGSSVAG